jgi:2-oxoglutarate ferredoxin oxidoreductase subunit beta
MTKTVFEADHVLKDMATHYCPGCGHGITEHMIGECIEELGIKERVIGILGVGCSSPSVNYMNIDMLSTPHGRPGAAATGLKRVSPGKIVFTYQGDGDAGSIGFSETVYAAIRGENILSIIINNTIYAMTGGQMAPTSLEGQVTITSPKGRDVLSSGYPLHLPEIVAQVPGAKFVARLSLHDAANIRKTKKFIKKAFQRQIDGAGYSLLEILSPCPSIWRLSPTECMEHIIKEISAEYPLGTFKEV